MAQYWDIDEKTGDYLQVNGSPIETDSLRIPAYIRLKVKRTQWLYAPDTDYGSDLYRIQKRQTNRDTSAIENIAGKALQPILNDGRAQRVDIDFQAVARHAVGIKVKIISAAGQIEELNLNPLGA